MGTVDAVFASASGKIVKVSLGVAEVFSFAHQLVTPSIWSETMA